MSDELNKLTCRLVVDHANFVQEWTHKNIDAGSGIQGAAVLATGLGHSLGIFCHKLSSDMGMSSNVLRTIIIDKLDKELESRDP